MTSRVPPSNKPPSRPSTNQSSPTPKVRRPTRPIAAEKPKPIKNAQGMSDEVSGLPEAMAWAGQDVAHSLEMMAVDVEARLAQAEAEKDQVTENTAELHEAAAKEEENEKGGSLFKLFNNWKKDKGLGGTGQTGKHSAHEPAGQTGKNAAHQPGSQTGKHAALQQPGQTNKVAALRPGQPVQGAVGVSTSGLDPVNASPNALAGNSATEARPDAFALLKEARDRGGFFVEDDGDSTGPDDELAAAVEECIRQCSAVPGILRIVPGLNDRAERVIVVSTTHGFSDASLAQVPEKVHRFFTLTAIPFDLLPLKRER